MWSCRSAPDYSEKDPSYEINHLLQISVRTQLGSDLNNLAAFNISKIKLQRFPTTEIYLHREMREESLSPKSISLLPLFWWPTAIQVLVFFWPPSLEMQWSLCGVRLGSPLSQLWLIQCLSSWVNSLIRSLSFFMEWLFPWEKWEKLKQYCASIWHTASRMFILNQIPWNWSRSVA